MLKGFRDFVLRGNVMDLAVAVIIGAAFTAIVSALTTDIINPFLGAFIGKHNFDYLIADVNGGKILYGAFLTAVLNFLILASVIYFFLVVPAQYLMKKFYPTGDHANDLIIAVTEQRTRADLDRLIEVLR